MAVGSIWFEKDPMFDRARGISPPRARRPRLAHWMIGPDGCGGLALLILLDQISRNLFRGSAAGFAADAKARAIARA